MFYYPNVCISSLVLGEVLLLSLDDVVGQSEIEKIEASIGIKLIFSLCSEIHNGFTLEFSKISKFLVELSGRLAPENIVVLEIVLRGLENPPFSFT